MNWVLEVAIFILLFVAGVVSGVFVSAGVERALGSRQRKFCPACRGTVWLESLSWGDKYTRMSARDLRGMADRMGLCEQHGNDYVALQFVVEEKKTE